MATQTYTDSVTLTAAAEFNEFDTAAYPQLTGVAGTNTVTATGPANLTLATSPILWFIPAVTNTGATTLNITPSGGAALGAKNVFFNGAALVAGELVAGVPTGVVYDGTQYNIIGSIVPATQAQQEAGTAVTLAVTSGRQQYHPSAAKGWCQATMAGGSDGAYNVTSVTDNGTGDATVTWATDFSNTAYCAVCSARRDGNAGIGQISNTTFAAGTTRVLCFTVADAAVDPNNLEIAVFGDQ